MPQVGDLEDVDVGFSTSLGMFSSKWTRKGNTFRLEIRTPKGTTGAVGVPLPSGHASAVLTGTGVKKDVVHADASGRYWVKGVAGGNYEFAVVGL